MSTFLSALAIAGVAAAVLSIVLLVSAVLIRAAAHLHNRFVGGPDSPRAVPEPSWDKAVGISLLIALVNCLVASVTGRDYSAVATSIVVELLVMAAVLTYVLPTRFRYALSVAVCHTIVLLIVGFVAAIGVAGAAFIVVAFT